MGRASVESSRSPGTGRSLRTQAVRALNTAAPARMRVARLRRPAASSGCLARLRRTAASSGGCPGAVLCGAVDDSSDGCVVETVWVSGYCDAVTHAGDPLRPSGAPDLAVPPPEAGPGASALAAPGGSAPAVSVIMAILNEERHLREAVTAILEQDYDGPVEVVLALGPSSDGTSRIAAGLARADPRVRTVRNPSGRTPEALNSALSVSRSPVVVRVDGHGVLDRHYVRTAVELLSRTGAANVGGIMHAEGRTHLERAVAAAMTSRLGVGSAAFHTGGQAGPADSVYLGVFRREWLDRLGGYDPRFVRAQDWELNHRIRAAGGVVYFSPELCVAYRPRATFRALARQYRDYGRWRRVVARTHSGTMNARYLAPPAAFLGVVGGMLLGFVWAPAWLAPAGYAVLVVVGGLTMSGDVTARERALLPLVLPTMHLCWGWGFLTSRIRVDGEPVVRPDPSAVAGRHT